MYDQDELTRALAVMGIEPTDTLLVHSSFKSIGPVAGGPDTVLDALGGYLVDGLLVFPTLSYASVGVKQPLFSVASTPSCVGILSEKFLKRPGVVRSWHPTHSVAALGREAIAFTAGHETFDTPNARQSPWGRLYDRQAKILFIGTGLVCNTFLHAVEEWLPVPGCLTAERQDLRILTPDGRIIACPSRRHQGAHSRFYAKPEALLLERGAVKMTRFGDAVCHLADAVMTADLVTRLLRKDALIFTDGRPLPFLDN